MAQQKLSLDALARSVLGNQIVLDYILVEQDGICAVANMACRTWIRTSDEVELELKKLEH